MDTMVFVCLQCGSCCKNLVNQHDGILRGMPLTEKEAKLFPADLISPRLAVGLKNPKYIITFQLNVSTCPHLDKSNQCAIYSKRPLVCKSFPILSGKINPECKNFDGIKESEHIAVANMELLIEADNELSLYTSSRFRKHFIKGVKQWRFDLSTHKWQVAAAHNEFPEPEDQAAGRS